MCGDRVHVPPDEDVGELVHGLLHAQRPAHDLLVRGDQRHEAGHAEEVRRHQQVDVQEVAVEHLHVEEERAGEGRGEGMKPMAFSAAWSEASVCPQAQMPQMRLVMCCASKIERPRSIASKKRGDSTTSKRQASSAAVPDVDHDVAVALDARQVLDVGCGTFLISGFLRRYSSFSFWLLRQRVKWPRMSSTVSPYLGRISFWASRSRVADQAAAAVADVAVVDHQEFAAGAGDRAEAGPPLSKTQTFSFCLHSTQTG